MPTTRLTISESLMLDIIRVTAAAVVAFGHLTRASFSTGWIDYTYVARNAVSVFFVLSGFVIRYVTLRRPVSLGHYLGDRASRMYSVAIPALLMTWLVDSLGRHLNPAYYATWSSNWSGEYNYAALRILVNLLFCGQLWTHTIAPLSNSAYWSINYEVTYYLAYGCFFYVTGRKRWFWIAAICLCCGPRVVYLSVLWILGCIAYDLYNHWNAKGTAAAWLNWLMLAPITAFSIIFLESSKHPGLTQLSVFSVFPHFYRMMNSVGVRPPEFAFGFLWAIIFLRLLLFARSIDIRERSRLVRSIRFLSEGTFPIYLTHFPLYVLIAACIPYDHGSPLQKILIFFGVLIVGVLAGHPCNLLKTRIRSLLFTDPKKAGAPSLQGSAL